MQGLSKATWSLKRAVRSFVGGILIQQKSTPSLKLIPYCLRSQSSSSPSRKEGCGHHHHVAIVGSGPAGYYTAQQLLKGDPNVVVDIYEKLPVPFGLVRFGVAPDHPEVKNVINTFTQTASKERCNFYGNIEVGKDVALADLRAVYSAVVLCYGAAEDKVLGIPGEDLPNVLPARSFVGWYNGLPQDRELPVKLDCEAAVVLGHGNVALDVARILLTPISILEKTDISEHALEVLRKSRIKQVHLVGRRGPLQVAFTIKELREMINLPDTRTVIHPSDVEGIDKVIQDLPRPRRRLTELLYKTSVSPKETDKKLWAEASKEWRLRFLRSPVRILSNETGLVDGVEFVVNELMGDQAENQKAVPTDAREIIKCGLVLRSIGYRSLALDKTVPFDSKRGVIDNQDSRVKGEKGLYCAGWVGRGPVGVILGTMSDGFETGKIILHDMTNGNLDPKDKEERDKLVERLRSKEVTFTDWEKIDIAEIEAGVKIGKPREKLVDVEAMLKIAKS